MSADSRPFLRDLDKKLWSAADRLRANLDAAVYKHAVLGLIFLKYVSDSFAIRQREIEAQLRDPKSDYYLDPTDFKSVAEYDAAIHAELEERDYYIEKNVFWVPALARWKTLQDSAPLPPGTEVEIINGKKTIYKITSIGKLIDDALDAVEKENPKLKNVLDKRYAQLQLPPESLIGLINLIATIPFEHADLHAKDILGHVYEYFLGQFALAEGKKGGQYFTPKSIVSLIVEMLEPYQGRVYDPAMGSGGFFVQSERFIEEHGGRLGNLSVYGQESNPTTWRLAAMNMAIRGIDFNFGAEPANSFTSDQHPDLRADYVMANPFFNDSEWWDAKLEGDLRWRYGTPPRSNANFGWIQHMVHHLTIDGTAGIVLADMSLASNDLAEGAIRKALIEADLVDCIVSLPDKLFTSTPIAASIWIISKNRTGGSYRDRRKEILFIDARRSFRPISRTLNDLPEEDVLTIATTYKNWRSKDFQFVPVKGFSEAVKSEVVAANRYALFPSAYITALEHVVVNSQLNLTEIIKCAEVARHCDNDTVNLLEATSADDFKSSRLETFTLGDVLERTTERLGNQEEPEILTCTESAGLILQRERFAKRIATENTQNYKVVRRGDIVYNPYLLWAGSIDQCWIVNIGITSPAYEVFIVREGFDPTLVGIALKQPVMLARFDGISIGTVKRRRRAPAENFLNLAIELPSKDVQKGLSATNAAIQNSLSAHAKLTLTYKDFLRERCIRYLSNSVE